MDDGVGSVEANTDLESHPDFALVWSFFSKFGKQLEMDGVMITDVVKWISTLSNQHSAIVAVMVKLMRKIGRRVDKQRWQKHLIKATATQDLGLATDLQTSGFHALSGQKKLKLLKMLCEMQFDDNLKFKTVINNEEADQQRIKPVGRDEDGLVYWHQEDEDLNIRVYIEDEDDDDDDTGWKLACKSKEDIADLIKKLTNEPTGKDKTAESDDEDENLVETKFQKFLKTQCTSESNDDKEEKRLSVKDDAMKVEDDGVFFENKEQRTAEERESSPKTKVIVESKLEKKDNVEVDVKSEIVTTDLPSAFGESKPEVKSEALPVIKKVGIANDKHAEPIDNQVSDVAKSNTPAIHEMSLNARKAGVTDEQFTKVKNIHAPAVTTAVNVNACGYSLTYLLIAKSSNIKVAPENGKPDISEPSLESVSGNTTQQSSRVKENGGISNETSELSEAGTNEPKSEPGKQLDSADVMSQPVNVITSLALQQPTLPRKEVLEKQLGNESTPKPEATSKSDNEKSTSECIEPNETKINAISNKTDDGSNIDVDSNESTLKVKTTSKSDNEKSAAECIVPNETNSNEIIKKTLDSVNTGVDSSDSASEPKVPSNSVDEKSADGDNILKNLRVESSTVTIPQVSSNDESSNTDQTSGLLSCQEGQTSKLHDKAQISAVEPTAANAKTVSSNSATQDSVHQSNSGCIPLTTEVLRDDTTKNSEVGSCEAGEKQEKLEGVASSEREESTDGGTEEKSSEVKIDISEQKDEAEAHQCHVEEDTKNVDPDGKEVEEGNVENLQGEEVEKAKRPALKKKGRRRRGRHAAKKKRSQQTVKKVRGDKPQQQSASRQKKWSRLEQLKVEAESILHKGEKKSEENKDAYRTRSGRRVRNAKKEEEELWQTLGDDVLDSHKGKDSEGDEEFRYVASKRGRPRMPAKETPVKTRKKIIDDEPCMRCGLSSHPETILLCDSCDKGHHMACLTPPLMLIPDDDWFCPKCSKTKLIARLKEIYDELEGKMKFQQRKARQNDYKKLLNDYTGISATNIITQRPKSEKGKPTTTTTTKRKRSYLSDSESDDLIDDDIYASSPSSPELKLTRRCRTKKISYDFSTFDKTILDAIGDDINEKTDFPDEKPVSGKDIRTIIAAEKGENAEDLIKDQTNAGPAKRKKRKLTNLNSDNEEAAESGSNYSVSSESEEDLSEEEFRRSNDTDNSEDSLAGRRRSRRRNSRGRRKPYVKPTKRSKRLRRKRIQEDFESASMSDASTEYEDAPKPKKAKKTKWNGYGRESSEDEYVPPRAVKNRKFIDDGDEDDEEVVEEKEKRTKRKRVMKSSSDEDDADKKQKSDKKSEQQIKNDGDVSSDDWSSLSSNAARTSDEESVSGDDAPKAEETTGATAES